VSCSSTTPRSDYPVRPGLFLRPAFREYLARIAAIPGLASDIVTQYLRDPGKDWAEAIDPLGRLLPTGLCDNRPFERFLASMFTGQGRTNDFRELRRKLYIVATELNSGYSVRFGEPATITCRSRARSRRAPRCRASIRRCRSTATPTSTAR
jgi:NTE family protein